MKSVTCSLVETGLQCEVIDVRDVLLSPYVQCDVVILTPYCLGHGY